MKPFFHGLFMAILCFPLFAQKPPVKFGEVAKEEVMMTTYVKDTSAAAVILADYGKSSILYRQHIGFSLDFERIMRIKILKKDGLDWGDFTIPLYKDGSDDEKLANLKAVTYNLEGGKVVESKLKNDAIFREKVDDHRDFVKFTCPNVREGSVVEVTYKVNSPFLFNFQDWSFQTSIPTVYSEYRAQIPEYFHYDRYTQGYVPLSVSEETRTGNAIRVTSFERSEGVVTQSQATTGQLNYMDVNHRWVAADVPAFKPEPYMTSINDYVTKINFELATIKFPNEPIKQIMGSWADINRTLSESEHFGGHIKGNGFLRKTAEEITAGLASPEEKIAAISHYVKENFAWDGNNRMYPGSNLKKVMDDRKGNSADLNFLLASMLDKVDIQVLPVAVSTRNHGLIRTATPVSSQFNYMIAMAIAGDKSYLLDATERFLPTGVLPERCLNGEGFAVSKDGFKWVPLDSRVKSRTLTSAEMVLLPTGELTGKLKVDCNGYLAMSRRKKYFLDGEEEFVKDFVGSHAWEVKASSIANVRELQKSFMQEHELVVNENMMVAADVIYLDPFILSSLKENPFKSETREYPVDFGSPLEQTFFLKLTLPEGYVVDELPKSKVISLPENGARYFYNAVIAGNQVTLTSMFQINKSMFTQIEYPSLREFYNQIVAKQAEQIVLKKKL